MKITLTIPNVSTNKLYTNSRTTGKKILSSIARATKEAWAWEAKAQYRGEPFERFVVAEVRLYFPDRKRRDLDNIKALLDSMTGILWKDDSCISDLTIYKRVDKKNPRIEIRAMDWPEETLI